MGSGTGEKKFASLKTFSFVQTVGNAKTFSTVETVGIAKSFSSIQTVGNAKMQTVGDAKSFISGEWKIPVRKTMPTAALL